MAIFRSIASLVDRERPPDDNLDVARPTSSCPSGHVGASTALYLAFGILALQESMPLAMSLRIGVIVRRRRTAYSIWTGGKT